MGNIINVANCANPSSVFNTGVPPCDLAKQKMRGIIFADKGVLFTPSDCASAISFLAAVKAKTIAARGGRVYPIWDINDFEDNTGEPNTGGVGNLSTATIVTSDAVPAFLFGYPGTEARNTRMGAMAGASLDVFFVDTQYAVYGTLSGNNIKGFSILQAYNYTSKFIISDAIKQYHFRITLANITEYRDQSAYVVANAGITAAVGLVDVTLSQLSNVTNVYKIQAFADGGTSLAALYGAAIAALTWTAINIDNNNSAVPVTSVAYDSTLDAFTVTFDSTTYNAMTPGQRIQLNGPTASALSGAGAKPYEMIPVIITHP